MKVLAISGSLRAASTNTALLEALAAVAIPPVQVTVWRGLATLPAFIPDDEGPPAPSAVEGFAALVRQADAVVMSSPEYVHAIPGALKNAIDWLVSRDEIIHKPVALLHASHRGADVLADLRRILATVSDRFAPDIFARFDLMKLSPEAVRDRLAGPEERQRLTAFLRDLEAFVRV